MSKYENWRELMDECGASGKPAKAWCLEHNISYNTYRGWLKRADEQTTEITSKKLAQSFFLWDLKTQQSQML